MDTQFPSTRWVAISNGSRRGFEVFYRPEEMKIDEREIIILPDITTDVQSGFSVGDKVSIMHESLWHLPAYTDKKKPRGCHYDQIYMILLFAEITARKRSIIRGTACILGGVSGKKVGLYQSDEYKPYLFWVGSLRKITE